MAVFLGLVAVIVIIVILVKVVKNRLEHKEYLERSADNEETNKRFKEAVEKGADPRTVVGFKAIEEYDILRNSAIYPVIKEIGMELVAKDYRLKCWRPEHDKDRGHSVRLSVYKEKDYHSLGDVEFWDKTNSYLTSSKNSYYTRHHLENRHMESKLCHMIQKFPNIFIKSEVALPNAPPEWLMICANVLNKYFSFTDDPDWVKEYHDAKRYVNVMF